VRLGQKPRRQHQDRQMRVLVQELSLQKPETAKEIPESVEKSLSCQMLRPEERDDCNRSTSQDEHPSMQNRGTMYRAGPR
jgi:hypothetical protein